MVDEVDVIKSLINNGAFGAVSLVSSNLEKDIDKGTQFASIISFMLVTVNNGSENLNYRIVIKKKHINDKVKHLFNSDISFRNEVIMYTKILPLLETKKLNLFPKLYLGINDENTLVFENVCSNGFMVAKEKVFLDYEHICLALIKLGEFHAISYIAKRKHKDAFYKLANELIETKFTNNITASDSDKKLYPNMLRGFNPLIERNIEVDILNKVIDKLKNSLNVAVALIKPEEPFSVICHGDFCRNNMFFKYDQNKPYDMKFFDLQNALYTSPAIDLAFFLYMNTTSEMRNKHWEEFLSIYWNAMLKLYPNIEFTFSQFLEHFAKHAIYGYFPTCFFLPISLEENQFTVEMISQLSIEEQTNLMLLQAGERGTKVLSDIVQHLLDKHYLHQFLEL